MGRRTIPDNARTTTALIFVPDAHSVSLAASMVAATLPFSPMAVGRHSSGTARGFSGIPGYGVNRMAHKLPYALQAFYSAIGPISQPRSRRLGAGAMPSGQPGLPSAGQQATSSIALMSFSQLGPGMGGF